jgi:uncharacterized coiled-coil DUF342 family protein
MTKREYKKKLNALEKEREKIIKSVTKATHFLLNLTKTRDMLNKRITDLKASYMNKMDDL